MARAIEQMLSLSFVIVGLSHVLQPKMWGDFFTEVFRTRSAPIVIAVFTLPYALLAVTMHNVWVWGLPLIATICGWALTIKCSLYLLVPAIPRRMGSQDFSRPYKWIAAGVFGIALGVAMGWEAWGPAAG